MAKKKRKDRAKRVESLEAKFIGPTLERIARNHFRSAGAARKLVPVIDTLHNKGDLTNEEYENLTYYRDQASLADKSPVRSCCGKTKSLGYFIHFEDAVAARLKANEELGFMPRHGKERAA